MKTFLFITLITLTLFSSSADAVEKSDINASTILLNKGIGFNVEGFKYDQSSFPCEINKVLVKKLVEQGLSKNIKVKTTDDLEKILNAKVPVLAIDIETLSLGSKGPKYGTKRDSPLPSVTVTAALIRNQSKAGFVTEKHSCAIMTLSELTSSMTDNVLDLGSDGVTVCSATHQCLNDLSKDIIEWLEPEIH